MEDKKGSKVTLEFEAITAWKIATVVLAILFIVSVVTRGFSGSSTEPTPTPVGNGDAPAPTGWSMNPKADLLFKSYAQELGLDRKKFDACLDNGDHKAEIQKDAADCEAAGTSGTPTFFINGRKIVGAQPYAAFEANITAALLDGKITNEVIGVDDDAVMGNKDAPVTMVSCEDYQCPFCQRAYQQTFPQIKQKYIDTGKVKYVFRDFPLAFHPQAELASEAAECAGDQGKYFEMHDKLFETQQ